MSKEKEQNEGDISRNDLLRKKFMSDYEANEAKRAREKAVLKDLFKSETRGKQLVFNNLR